MMHPSRVRLDSGTASLLNLCRLYGGRQNCIWNFYAGCMPSVWSATSKLREQLQRRAAKCRGAVIMKIYFWKCHSTLRTVGANPTSTANDCSVYPDGRDADHKLGDGWWGIAVMVALC